MGDVRFIGGPDLIERYRTWAEELKGIIDRAWNQEQELVRQFVEDDLRNLIGPRKGERLTSNGRARRLRQLLEAHDRCRDKHRELETVRAHITNERDRFAPGDRQVAEDGDDGDAA